MFTTAKPVPMFATYKADGSGLWELASQLASVAHSMLMKNEWARVVVAFDQNEGGVFVYEGDSLGTPYIDQVRIPCADAIDQTKCRIADAIRTLPIYRAA